MDKLLVTIPEALEATSIGRSVFYQLIADNKIKTLKLGKRRLVDVASLKLFVESLSTSTGN